MDESTAVSSSTDQKLVRRRKDAVCVWLSFVSFFLSSTSYYLVAIVRRCRGAGEDSAGDGGVRGRRPAVLQHQEGELFHPGCKYSSFVGGIVCAGAVVRSSV